MNVLRMIKLFGWENKMNERIAVKREEELVWIKRKQFLELLNAMIKCVRLSARSMTEDADELYSFLIPVITMVATFGT